MLREKRLYPRVNLCLPLKISSQDVDIITETKNISGNGVYCYVDRDIDLMTKSKIILLVPVIKKGAKVLKRINCKGVVVRKDKVKGEDNGRNKYNIAIFFNEIKEKDRNILISYLNSFINSPSS